MIVWASDRARLRGGAPGPVPRSRGRSSSPSRRGARCERTCSIDCGRATAYDAGHVPGAVHLDPESDLSATGADPAVGGRHPLPTPSSSSEVFARVGIEPRLVRARPTTTARAGRRAAGGSCATSATTRPATFDLRGYVGPLSTDDAARTAARATSGRDRAAATRSRPRRSCARLDDPALLLLDARSRVALASARRSRSTRSPAGSPARVNAYFDRPAARPGGRRAPRSSPTAAPA